MRDINGLDMPKRHEDYTHEEVEEISGSFEKVRADVIYPYAERMGNCEAICLGGDYMIYEQYPEGCGRIARIS